MGNTTFYREAQEDIEKITWKEILSDCRKPHSKAELEYALLAGTSMDSANEANMLQKWHKPWVFYPLLKAGVALTAIIYVTYFLLGFATSGNYMMVLFLPPLIMPIVLMVFLWELNIPRNISIYELFAFFLIGGLLSMGLVSPLFGVFPDINVQHESDILPWALNTALREEVAKLAAGLLILWWAGSKQKKHIYGLTGLVIGAAVGAGFSGFESIWYAMKESIVVRNQIMRALFSFGSHIAYATPYTAAFALNMKNGKITIDSFKDPLFLKAFGLSTTLHFIWDYVCSDEDFQNFTVIIKIGFTIALWLMLLYVIRRCLQQVVNAGRYHSRTYPIANSAALTLQCISGPMQGAVWKLSTGQKTVIGRDPGCQIVLPNAQGVSRRHCSFQCGPAGWTVTDLNSSYGTYFSNGKKLMPGLDEPLRSGDVLYLASRQIALKIFLN